MSTCSGAPVSAASSAARPGCSVLPSNRSQWIGTSTDAPIRGGQRHGVAGVHVAGEVGLLAEVGAAVDRQQRDVDGQALERRHDRVGDERVARVVEAHAVELEHVADEPRVVGVAVARVDGVHGRHDGRRARVPQLDSVAARHAHELRVGARLAHHRLERRRGDDRELRAALGHRAQRRRVEVVEVLVGHEQPVDVTLHRRRRVAAPLVLGEERVDEDPPPGGLEQEPRLPEPCHDRGHGARITFAAWTH